MLTHVYPNVCDILVDDGIVDRVAGRDALTGRRERVERDEHQLEMCLGPIQQLGADAARHELTGQTRRVRFES